MVQFFFTGVDVSDGKSFGRDLKKSEPTTIHGSVQNVEQRQLIVVSNRGQIERRHHSLRHRRIHCSWPVHAHPPQPNRSDYLTVNQS